MTREQVRDRLIPLIVEVSGVEDADIGDDTEFAADLNFDSLDFVELVMDIEDEFETSISDAEAEKCTCVGHAVDALTRPHRHIKREGVTMTTANRKAKS